MNWHYVNAGQPAGPISDVELGNLVQSGVIQPETLVWNETMSSWQPYSQMKPSSALSLSGPVTGRLASCPDTAPSGSPVQACSQCGRVLSPEMVIPLGGALVCAACKPLSLQKMREGLPVSTGPVASSLFFYIPVSRLILLSIVTMGLYEVYWLFMNWRFFKKRDNLAIRPFWRAVFGIFYCPSLLRRIHQDPEARSVQMPSFSPGPLATIWIILIFVGNVVARGSSATGSIAAALMPSFLCLVPVQNYINSVNKARDPKQAYHRWSVGHIILLVIALLIWLGVFFPES